MNVRHSFSEILSSYPDLFWILAYAAWGGIFAAVTVSGAAFAILIGMREKRHEISMALRLPVQIIWGIAHILAIFALPWVLGALAPGVLRESKYFGVTLVVWAMVTGMVYLLGKPFWKSVADRMKWSDDA